MGSWKLITFRYILSTYHRKMQKRTFIRTMLDIFFNNALVKTIVSVVNFCNEQRYYNNHELKFLKNMPINKIEQKQTLNRYVFQGTRTVRH